MQKTIPFYKKHFVLFILIYSFDIINAQCGFEFDYASLRALYLTTNGDNWKNHTGWPNKVQFDANYEMPVGTDLSLWFGITCEKGLVTEIDLSNNGLNGIITNEFNVLNLTSLKLNNNLIYGSIPENLKKMVKLKYLDLSNNKFSGNIPAAISFLNADTYINLNSNKFSGCFEQYLSKFCNKNFYCENNNLLPDQGNFNSFCTTNNNLLIQIGAPCKNGNSSDGENDFIQADCRCGLLPCENPDNHPFNDKCTQAFDLGSDVTPISVSGNNKCASSSDKCNTSGESSVYYTYTIPNTGLRKIEFSVSGLAGAVISVGESCTFGVNCSPSQVIQCPKKGATYYILVSSAAMNAGNFLLNVYPEYELITISGQIYTDINANGVFDGVDIGLGGNTVELLAGCHGGAVVSSTTAGTDGNYSFMNLQPGFYTVKVIPGPNQDTPNPGECCLEVKTCMPTPDLKCDIGFPPPNCTANPYSADNICENAIPICDLRVIGDYPCSQNPEEFGPWLNQAHCAGIYHNTSFYKFVAGSGNYNIQFTIFNCAGLGV